MEDKIDSTKKWAVSNQKEKSIYRINVTGEQQSAGSSDGIELEAKGASPSLTKTSYF